jgi:hypothetical protein
MKRLKPNNLGKKYLVEQCERVSINDYLRQAKKKIKESLINSQLEIEGLNIDLTIGKTNFNGLRLWFKCPICNKRVGVLYRHAISRILGCRGCLGLEYRCRKYKGMIENSINK